MANNVQKEETIVTLNFVLLDCSPLKFALLSHCNEWQNGFTRVLKEMAINRLTDLHAFLKTNSEKYVLHLSSFTFVLKTALYDQTPALNNL